MTRYQPALRGMAGHINPVPVEFQPAISAQAQHQVLVYRSFISTNLARK